nr:MFS transporter [Marinobacterium sedimentorum]
MTQETLWRYGALGLPLALPTVAVYVLLPTWYAEQRGLGLTQIGLILLLTRLFDVITDPLVGLFMDRHPKVPLTTLTLTGGLICTPALLLLVNPITPSAALSLLTALLLFYAGWTLIQIPYLAWLPRLHPDSLERNRATGYREALALGGLVLSAALPALLGLAGLGVQQSLNALVILAMAAGFAALQALRGLPQPPAPPPTAGHSARPELLFLDNRLALRLLLGWFINGLGNGFAAILFPLFVSSYLGGGDQARALYILLYFIAAILSLPLWQGLSRLVPRARLWCLAMLAAILAFAFAPLLNADTALWFMPICLITGAALGADLTLPHVIQAEVADWDRYRFGAERNASLFACWNMATKLALGLSAGSAFLLLGAGGFDVAAPKTQSLWLLALVYAVVPCLCKGAAIVLLWNFPLRPGHHRAIQRRLARRHDGHTE